MPTERKGERMLIVYYSWSVWGRCEQEVLWTRKGQVTDQDFVEKLHLPSGSPLVMALLLLLPPPSFLLLPPLLLALPWAWLAVRGD